MASSRRCTALLLAFCCLSCGASPPGGFALEQVADGIYLHRGRHADIDDPARADSANLAFIEGERCLAVIDSGGAMATAAAFAAAIRQHSRKPVCYVINTHVHFDHVLGNAAFVTPATRIVGHHNLAEAIAANRDYFAEAFAPELGGAAVIGPDITVADSLDLDLGQRSLRLVAEPTAHTHADLTVLDLKTSTLFTGDLLFRERMPVLDGSLKGWLGWMAQAMQQSYTLVVPGHGPPDRAWPHGAQAQLDYFNALLEDTRRAIADGVLIEDAKAKVASGQRGAWLLTERAHGLNVSRAYRELEWE